MQEFKEIDIKNIPEEVSVPLERLEENPVFEAESILNELGVLKIHEGTEEAQIRMVPKINELVKELQALQAKDNAKEIGVNLASLIAERERINNIKN